MKYTGILLSIAALAATALWLLDQPAYERVTADGSQETHPGVTAPVTPVERQIAAPRASGIEDTATETVMGITVRKDRNCTVTRHYLDLGNGMVSEAFSCVAPEGAPGEYAHYDNETLAALAYSESGAAGALGKRLVEADPERARTLILRALALEPRNVEPAMWLASQAYSLRGGSVAARRAVANHYVITRVVRELGAEVGLDWIVDDLREAGFDDAAIAGLDARVEDDLHDIREIQLEVFGESTIAGELP